MTPYELNTRICEILDDKKATEITVLNVTHLTVLADYFTIATARSSSQVKALAEAVMDKLSKQENGFEPTRVDGLNEGRWVVLDYGTSIVHIFNDETRMIYCLEKLWSDGTNIEKFEGTK
ncbi:MAG: ribosome silencing factor [Clostridia bacterium]